MITIYEKSTCSKCGLLQQIFKDKGIAHTVINFHKEKMAAHKLQELADKCNLTLSEMLRTSEQIYTELDVANRVLTDDELAEIMVANPDLIERPIIETSNEATIGRAPHNFMAFIESLNKE